jgi:S1-C subfamily serine protease
MHNALSMFGLNWVDVIIVVLLILAAIEGIRIGLLTQLFAILGFFITLFVAGWFFPHILPINDKTVKTILNAGLVLLSSGYVSIRSIDLAQKIHWSFRLGGLTSKRTLETLETILGGLPAVISGLVLVWLLGVAISRLPFEGLSNSVSDSLIVQQLTRRFPSVPSVFAEFDKQVNPNSEPAVSLQPKPYASFNYSLSDEQIAASKATKSVVRITSFSCGGIVAGSGFIANSDLVVTNAHVIAGSKRPIIKYEGKSYVGVPIYFNSSLDLAILQVQNLKGTSLVPAPGNVTLNTTVAILGYPGGNYSIIPGIIRDTLAVSAANIYDQGSFGHGIYVVQAGISSGSSGSPIVLSNGQVAGIIFSQSTSIKNYAYALTSANIINGLDRAQASDKRVNDGACAI